MSTIFLLKTYHKTSLYWIWRNTVKNLYCINIYIALVYNAKFKGDSRRARDWIHEETYPEAIIQIFQRFLNPDLAPKIRDSFCYSQMLENSIGCWFDGFVKIHRQVWIFKIRDSFCYSQMLENSIGCWFDGFVKIHRQVWIVIRVVVFFI